MSKNVCNFGTAEVTVDHERVVTALSANVGEVDQRGGFPLAGPAGHDRDGVGVRAFSIEFDVRSQNPVGFGVRAEAALLVQDADVLRNDREDGHAEVALDVIERLDAGIEVFEEECEPDAEDESDDRAEAQLELGIRFGVAVRGDREFVDRRRLLRHHCGQFRLFLFLDHLLQDVELQAVIVARLLVFDHAGLFLDGQVLLFRDDLPDVGKRLFLHLQLVLEVHLRRLDPFFKDALGFGEAFLHRRNVGMEFPKSQGEHLLEVDLVLEVGIEDGVGFRVDDPHSGRCADEFLAVLVPQRLQAAGHVGDFGLHIKFPVHGFSHQ